MTRTAREPSQGRGADKRSRGSRYPKLKPGPGHSSEEVRANQRARLQGAMIDLTAERGYAGVTVRALTRLAGVSTRAFYKHFPNVEECFASTYRLITRSAIDQLTEATKGRDWGDGVRAWIQALTASVVANPRAAKLALVDCYDGGPAMLREVAQATDGFERQLVTRSSSIPLPLSRGILAGVERVVRTSVLEGREAELPGLADELSDWAMSTHDSKPAPARLSSPGAFGRESSRSTARSEDPGFATFEAIGGDRGRILTAVAKLSVTDGYWNVTPPSLRREAGVSRRRFDALFSGVTSCYIEAIEALTIGAVRTAANEVDATLGQPGSLNQIAGPFYDEVTRSPLLSHLGFIDIFAPGTAGLFCRERLLTTAVDWIRRPTRSQRVAGSLPVEAAIAGIWRVIQAELMAAGASAPTDRQPFIARLIPSY